MRNRAHLASWIALFAAGTACGPTEVDPNSFTYVTPVVAHANTSSSTTGTNTTGAAAAITTGTTGTTSTTGTVAAGATTTGGSTTGGQSPPTTPAPPAKTTLSEGGKIVARLATNRCLDINGGGTADGTVVQIYDCNGYAPAQGWLWVGGSLRASGSRCLDVAGIPGVNAQLVIKACDAARPATQQWSWDDGALTMTVNGTQYCAALSYGNTANLTMVQLATCAPSNDAQHWDSPSMAMAPVAAPLVCVSGGASSLAACTQESWGVVSHSAPGVSISVGGKCLQADSANADAAVSMAACAGQSTHQWVLTQGTLRLAATSLCVQQQSAALSLKGCDASAAAQQWSFGGVP